MMQRMAIMPMGCDDWHLQIKAERQFKVNVHPVLEMSSFERNSHHAMDRAVLAIWGYTVWLSRAANVIITLLGRYQVSRWMHVMPEKKNVNDVRVTLTFTEKWQSNRMPTPPDCKMSIISLRRAPKPLG
jgi:hypothetical protein